SAGPEHRRGAGRAGAEAVRLRHPRDHGVARRREGAWHDSEGAGAWPPRLLGPPGLLPDDDARLGSPAPHRRRLGGGDRYPPGHWPDRPRQCRRPVWTRTPPRRAAEPGRHNSGLEPAGRGASRSDAGRDRITAQPPGSEMAMNATTPEPTTQAATFVTRCRD